MNDDLVVPDVHVSWGRERLARIVSWIGKGAAVAGSLALGLATGIDRGGDPLGALWATAWFLFFVAIVVSYVIHFARGIRLATVRLSARYLTVVYGRRERRIARSDVRGALMVDRPVRANAVPTLEVELETRERIVIHFGDDASRLAFRTALGFGPAGARTRVRLEAPSHRLLHLPVGLLVYIAASVAGQAFVVLALATLHVQGGWIAAALALNTALMLAVHAVVCRLIAPPVVTVGGDGVLVERGFKKQFIARRDLMWITRPGGALPPVLQLRNGDVRTLGGTMVDAIRRMALASLIAEWLAARSEGPDPSVHFERAGRDVPTWKEHLGDLIDGAGYRGARASTEDASAVLESPLSTVDQRVGAALALRIAKEPEARVRVQVERLADPAAREAVLAALEDDEPALEAALARAARLDPGAKSR